MQKIFFLFLLLIIQTTASYAQGWFELGTGSNALKANSGINCLCTDDSDNVYAAGGFWDSTSFSVGRGYVARWSTLTHQWSEVGTGSNKLNANSGISTICRDNYGNLYAAGAFTDSTIFTHFAVGNCYVAKWNGTTWSRLGTGSHALNVGGSINSICSDKSGNIYAAGNFQNIYGNYYVAKWDGTNWSDLGNLNVNLFINSICVDDSMNVYAAGNFTDTAGRTYVAKFNPHIGFWTELGIGFGSSTEELVINSIFTDTPDHVCAGVNFRPRTLTTITSNVFKWDNSNWHQLGNLNGNNFTYPICKGDSGYIYAGGGFTNAAGKPYVAKWSPQTNTWSELGSASLALDSNSGIGCLCIDKHYHLYAAGGFTDTVSTPYNYQYVAEYGISTLNVLPLSKNDCGIEVYPNPANNILTFEFPASGDATVKVMDITGRVMEQQTIHSNNHTTFDVKGYSPGVYIYQVVTGGKTQSGKVIVQ